MSGYEGELRELDRHEEHPGGGRFNHLLLIVVVGIAMIVGIVAMQGIRSAGVTVPSTGAQPTDDGVDAARDKAEVDELAAGASRPSMARARSRSRGRKAAMAARVLMATRRAIRL